MESAFLQTAITEKTPLTIVLQKGEELSGTVQEVERHNIACLIDGETQTIPKREIAYLLFSGELIRPELTPVEEGQEAGLQDTMLSTYRDQKRNVAVTLIGGSSRWGIVGGFDPFTILLNHRTGQSLIYKHSIAFIAEVRRPAGGSRKPRGKNHTERQDVGEKPVRDTASAG